MSKINNQLKKWKKRLGLSDWDITVKYRDAQDLNQSQGKTIVRAPMQTADIRLMKQTDRQKSDPSDSDIELDLVHELVHVRLWSIDPYEAEGVEHVCREQAVEKLAQALIISDRGKK